jgi:hypothetical protein
MFCIRQWFATCGTRTAGGTRRKGWEVRENNIANGGKHKKKYLK